MYTIQVYEKKDSRMQKHSFPIPLNRQQLELIDRTVAQGHGKDRADLLLRALREVLLAQTQVPGTGACRPEMPQ